LGTVRTTLKAMVPRPLRNAARLPLTYGRRLAVWRSVLATMHGEADQDRQVLVRSARAALLTSLRGPNEWQDPVLVDDATLAVDGVGRFALRAASDDLYHVLPAREPEVLAAIRDTLEPGTLFIDAGANIGFYTVVGAKAVGPGGGVFAVEMMPDTLDRLRQTVAMNQVGDRVTILPHALAERSGDTVVATVAPGKFGQASIARGPQAGERRHSLLTRRLDDLIPGEQLIRLIKLDLEGAELGALKGATRILEKTGAIIFEQLGRDREVADFLRGRGFALRRLDHNNWIAERPR
jgi:FkbM family methyltransferase